MDPIESSVDVAAGSVVSSGSVRVGMGRKGPVDEVTQLVGVGNPSGPEDLNGGIIDRTNDKEQVWGSSVFDDLKERVSEEACGRVICRTPDPWAKEVGPSSGS